MMHQTPRKDGNLNISPDKVDDKTNKDQSSPFKTPAKGEGESATKRDHSFL